MQVVGHGAWFGPFWSIENGTKIQLEYYWYGCTASYDDI
jgi:hypothetical protein